MNDLKNNSAMLIRFIVVELIMVVLLLTDSPMELAIGFAGLGVWYSFDVSNKLSKLEKVSGWKRFSWLDTLVLALVGGSFLVWYLKWVGAVVNNEWLGALKIATLVAVWFAMVIVFVNYTWLYMKGYSKDNDGGYEDTDFDDECDDCDDITCELHPDYDYNRGFNDGYDNGMSDMKDKADKNMMPIMFEVGLKCLADGYELGYEEGLKDGYSETLVEKELKKKNRKATKKQVRQAVRKPKKAKK